MEHSWDRRIYRGKEGEGAHTHTHIHKVTLGAKVEACEPETGACLARDGRRVQEVQRDPTCRRSHPYSQLRYGSLQHPGDMAHLRPQKNMSVTLNVCVRACECD